MVDKDLKIKLNPSNTLWFTCKLHILRSFNFFCARFPFNNPSNGLYRSPFWKSWGLDVADLRSPRHYLNQYLHPLHALWRGTVQLEAGMPTDLYLERFVWNWLSFSKLWSLGYRAVVWELDSEGGLEGEPRWWLQLAVFASWSTSTWTSIDVATTIVDPVALPLLYYRDFSLGFLCEVCFHINRKRTNTGGKTRASNQPGYKF